MVLDEPIYRFPLGERERESSRCVCQKRACEGEKKIIQFARSRGVDKLSSILGIMYVIR